MSIVRLSLIAVLALPLACSEPAPDPVPQPASAAPSNPEPAKPDTPAPEPAESDDKMAGSAEPEAAAVEAAAPEAASEGAASEPAAAEATKVAAKPMAKPATFNVDKSGTARFLIDAPLEKIKGKWSVFGGSLTINPADLNATRGEVIMDLSTLKTHTFGDPGKDAKQTGHALNWMEIGDDVSPDKRQKFMKSRFVIDSISGAKAGVAEQTVTANGKLTLHGITVPKTVKLNVILEGPPEAPTAVRIKTAAPMVVSLEKHDVKPRDLAGRFLAGALEKVGEKITDRSQVTLDIKATRAP